ncbi:topoisomerase II-associated protein PAT1 [Drechmeria coniospora]|uniref:Topoisomerase II-associated protein PAT1 n=1 Tax=Drechmeria coniospora TaxID=98403 RepID=A0A151GPW3_DRECN|nr:topoisomerase II-associated protein PAT1 [Drechmeria coniospora]KYK59136.1 topoisomerase II-associated protein PAT1 [Drechmeria coniospora]
MSFFGFDATGGRHNTTAPGFSQSHDPFASLAGRGDLVDEALEFEDTYDGLGDQLDETDDAFNDDTFGGDTAVTGKVGKDFDFFGQTAKVSDAIEEEQLRYHLQPPKGSVAQAHPQAHAHAHAHAHVEAHPMAHPMAAYQQNQYYDQQQQQRPARTGYEKYRDEPMPDLHVDQSIWGMGPAKTAAPAAQPATHVVPAPAPAGRKMMSLEEVEAAMQAQSVQKDPVQHPVPEPAMYFQDAAGYQAAHQQQQPQPHPGHGHPVTILQRPQSLQPKPSASPAKTATPPLQQTQQQRQQGPMQPMQILQNPNRTPGDAARVGLDQQPSQSQGLGPLMQQMHAHPQLMHMSEDEKAAFLDQEMKRAKRNHKIWLLSKDNGFMTPHDKNFITRIQLQQLVSATGNSGERGIDDSLAEDFYFQVYSHIRAGQRQNPGQPLSNFAQTYLLQTGKRQSGMRRHGRPAQTHMQRMEQQVQRAVEAAKNKPKNPQLVIAGSLGKISFSNAKTPKPLLNIKRPESETGRPVGNKKPAAQNGLDRKRILRNVEMVYTTLMKIEDHVRLLPPPLSGPDAELQKKHEEWAAALEAFNAKLWSELKVHEPIGATALHPFIAFLSCAKGKKAIPRIFPHLSFEQRTTILTMIVYHLDQLDVVDGAAVSNGETHLNSRMRENIELFISTVMPSLMQYFNDTGLDIVDGVLNLMATKLNVDLIVRTRIGVSMLTLILSRAVLLKQTGAGSPEQWEKWYDDTLAELEPSLPAMFPGSVNAGVDVYVWQLLAAMGVSATHDQQTRLVLAVKDRVLDTVTLSKTLPPAMAAERLGSVNLFMRSIGLDVELLQ